MSNYGFTIPTGGYDGEDRLVSFNCTSGLSQSWNLSSVGDWNSVSTNGTAQTRTHGPTHELLTGGGSNVDTDTKGYITLIPASLRTRAASLTSVWDFDNRIVSATTGSTTVSHEYDALGCRVARTTGGATTVYVQVGQQTIADYVSGASPASSTYRYLYASYIDEPVMRWTTSSSTAAYYHRNQQYSVTAITDSSGSVLERYAYTAYGVPTIANSSGTVLSASAHSNRYMYTGREWDNDIQQYHYRARMYDASLGRFCSRDPIGYVDGASIYCSYLGLSELDPSGESVDDNITIPFLPPINGIHPCGRFSFDADASVTGIVPGVIGSIAVKVAINNGLKKKFPIHFGMKVDCLFGRCCPIQTFILNLKIVFKGRPAKVPKYLATITIDTDTKLTIGVCLDAKCPCPIPLPDMSKSLTIHIPGEFPLENKEDK